MKYYILNGIVDHKVVNVKKRFKTRDTAINYIFNRMKYDSQLIDEINHGDHNIEYVCNHNNRFFIRRYIA